MIDKPDDETLDTNTTEEQEPAQTMPPLKRSKSAFFALFIAFVALFFTAAGIAAGYKHWQRMDAKAEANEVAIAAIQAELAAKSDSATLEQYRAQLDQTVQQVEQTMASKLSNMEALQSQTEQFASTVTAQIDQVTRLQAQAQQNASGSTSHEWQLEEVEFLLKLANHELHLGNNPQAARAALQAADEGLGAIGSVSFLPVRQQIASDLNTLEHSRRPDQIAISQKITALVRAIPPLDFSGRAAESASAPTSAEALSKEAASSNEPPSTHSESSIWHQYQQEARYWLDSTFLITSLDEPITTALTDTTRHSLYQLLQLQAENLRLLAVQERDQDYHQHIQLMRETLTAYYPESVRRPLLRQLDDLDSVDLNMEWPDISGSLTQLQQARRAETASHTPQHNTNNKEVQP